MTEAAAVRSPVERFFERVLAWFDEDHEAKRDARAGSLLEGAAAGRQAIGAAPGTPLIQRRQRHR